MKTCRKFLFIRPIILCALALLGSGCKDKNAIKDYRVSKGGPETAAPETPTMSAMPQAGAAMQTGAPAGNPSFVTEKPAPNWLPQPLTSMRQASYLVQGDGGATADISLVLLAGSAGGILDNINRWLSQLGQTGITTDQLEKTAQHVNSALGDVTVVDLEGLPQGGDPAKDGRIIAGILSNDGGSYFFKMRGNATLAESQKEAFIQWVGSVQKSESANVSSAPDGIAGALPSSPTCPVVGPDGKAIAAASQAAPGAGAQPGTAACPVVGAKGKMPAASGATEPVVAAPAAALEKPQIKMEAPVGWKTVPPSTMRYASFAVTNDGGESADISVSTFGGEGGGDLENVNRWRQQIGLEAIGAGELKGMIVPVPCKDGEILTVDMTGREARILAGWARVDGKSWFFKLAGAKQLSEAQKGNFVKFLQSVQFHP